MADYGNLCTPNGDKIEIKHGSVGGVHPAKDELTHRTHNLGGEIAKPKEVWKFRPHKLGGHPGEGAITDTSHATHGR